MYWKMRVFTVYEDERETIRTNVSECGLQRQSNKGKLSSNKVSRSLRFHIGHTITHDKTIQTRTFLIYHHHQYFPQDFQIVYLKKNH